MHAEFARDIQIGCIESRYTVRFSVSAPALGGAEANLSGPNLGHESLLIKAGVMFQWTSRISITIDYDGQVAREHCDSHSVTGTFSYSF